MENRKKKRKKNNNDSDDEDSCNTDSEDEHSEGAEKRNDPMYSTYHPASIMKNKEYHMDEASGEFV